MVSPDWHHVDLRLIFLCRCHMVPKVGLAIFNLVRIIVEKEWKLLFDPTAYENIKVVIEGDIYDRDLSGEIIVIDRNDWINAAKLSRKYEISFTKKGYEPDLLSAMMTIEAGLENLSAELLESVNAEQLAGCLVNISFSLLHTNEIVVSKEVQYVLEDIWGKDRLIAQTALLDPLEDKPMIKSHVQVSFNRLVYEEQIADLSEMVDYMIASLEKIKKIIE
jgi:alpha-D-ribose 1-methylphosphonate 5-triphosphate synthase subunit PhnI